MLVISIQLVRWLRVVSWRTLAPPGNSFYGCHEIRHRHEIHSAGATKFGTFIEFSFAGDTKFGTITKITLRGTRNLRDLVFGTVPTRRSREPIYPPMMNRDSKSQRSIWRFSNYVLYGLTFLYICQTIRAREGLRAAPLIPARTNTGLSGRRSQTPPDTRNGYRRRIMVQNEEDHSRPPFHN